MKKFNYPDYCGDSVLRVSVANKVSLFQEKLVGILNKNSLEQSGERVLTCVGGAAQVFDYEYLKRLGAFDFSVNEDGTYDARFYIPKEIQYQIIREILEKREKLVEFDPGREVLEELSIEKVGDQEDVILDIKDALEITYKYLGSYVGMRKSTRNPKVQTIAIWNYFAGELPEDVAQKLFASSYLFQIGSQELDRGMYSNIYPLGEDIRKALSFETK
ncbi:hypothetical protein [Candidatus Absconditicoccus praedator]|uniref:hypothetical protein n=1 Tax=Candidatus Absconditicoccus praedator TaxID=2735562 RepID=UPI001E48FCDC|nr:hypothetical protein [Candidatus Absconditicoccus praedator]UFX82652.1 hypothetical protein HLG78_00675 [Candidatus Absconditicoccus praedator]